MYRLFSLLLASVILPAQTLDRPPQDIDDSLRDRVKQFYDYHVAQKYRLCEQLISEEAKDDFYVIKKPALESFKIGSIDYSDNFTKAKVLIIGRMPVLMPLVGPKIMDQPFASYWRFENGNWFWYYVKQAAPQNSEAASPEMNIATLQSAVKIDRTRIDITDGKPQVVRITNTLPGTVSLSLQPPAGIITKFDKQELKANESAELTVNSRPNAIAGPVHLQIVVLPTNQVLELTVNVAPR